MFSARPKSGEDADGEGVAPAEFQDYFVRQARFTAGTATRYDPSIITGQSTHQHLARGFTIGTRLHSAPVVRLADAKPVQLGHVVKADGRWRLFAFADGENPADTRSMLSALCNFLAESSESPVKRFTRPGADIDSVIETLAVFQQGHGALVIEAMHQLLLPRKGRYGLIDYEKMFCPDLKSRNDIYEMRGIDRQKGCVVVVRPDQYVANVLPLDAYDEISAFFNGFMIQPAS
jgi:phenol 2-monooxygenase